MDWTKYEPYFNSWEFDSPDLPGSGKNMNEEFMDFLLEARKRHNIPFIINSGYRTQAHNDKVGGAKNSAHTKGLAADIAAANSRHRYIILRSLFLSGFNRIGIGENFIHVDMDTSKDFSVIWLY